MKLRSGVAAQSTSLALFLVALAAEPAAAQQPVGDDGFAILSQLFTYDAALPLNARTLEPFDTIGFTRQKFMMDGWRDSRVPGLIAIPKTAAARHPVVVLIDGIGGWKERWWQQTSWNRGRVLIDSLLASGYAVAMIDAPASGERTHENDYVTAETFIAKFSQLRDMELQNTIEHRRLLDYLATRPDVDTTRVGALGLSLGGMTTFYLGAFEPRLKVAVAGVTPMQRIPDLFLPVHYAGRVRIPMLMLAGRTDTFYTQAQVERVLGLLSAKEKKLIWYDTGHRLPESYAGDAVTWFRTNL